MATRKFKITYMGLIIFLLTSTVLGITQNLLLLGNLVSSSQMLDIITHGTRQMRNEEFFERLFDVSKRMSAAHLICNGNILFNPSFLPSG